MCSICDMYIYQTTYVYIYVYHMYYTIHMGVLCIIHTHMYKFVYVYWYIYKVLGENFSSIYFSLNGQGL